MSLFNKVYPEVSKLTLPNLTNIILFRNSSFSDFSDKINALILDATIEHILSTKRFDPLL